MSRSKNTRVFLRAVALSGVLSVVLSTLIAPPAAAYIACGFGATNVASQAIPDNGTITSTQDLTNMADRDPLLDIDVVLNVTHTFDADLEVSLTSGGQTVMLTTRRGGAGDNFTNTRFNDGAANPISAGAAPFTGHFRPEQSLNAFDDLDPGRVWTLTVSDKATTDTGTLQSWTLIFRTRWCDDGDRDDVKDANDDCMMVKGVAPHGCPRRGRTVSISYNNAAKEFRGVLKCTADSRCANAQPVRIYRVRSGKDALISRGFTNATGSYAFLKDSVSGKYYAVAPKVYEEGVAECKRARSVNLAL